MASLPCFGDVKPDSSSLYHYFYITRIVWNADDLFRCNGSWRGRIKVLCCGCWYKGGCFLEFSVRYSVLCNLTKDLFGRIIKLFVSDYLEDVKQKADNVGGTDYFNVFTKWGRHITSSRVILVPVRFQWSLPCWFRKTFVFLITSLGGLHFMLLEWGF